MTTPAPLLALENISVNFGGLRALSDLSLRVRPGSLHGLVGPNGAGKTTAMNVISGLVRPTSGTMNYNGRPFRPKPDALAGMGVARTFQASAFIESLSACENVMFGGHSNTRSGVLACMLGLARAQSEERALRERAEAALTEVGYAGASQARAADLTTWQRRQIEIARALVSRPRLLLLDEPAAGLTAHEVEQLKALLHRLREEGGGERAVLLIEHNVPLVFSLCDVVTAMAQGRDLAQGSPQEIRGHADVIRSYLGAASERVQASASNRIAEAIADRPVVLRLDGVCAGYGASTVLHDITLEVREGEAVALFGPNGAGKTTLLNTVIGERRATAGAVTWLGRRIDAQTTQSIVRQGIGIVPQGRIVMERQSVEDNLLISTTGLRLSARQWRERREEIYTQFPKLAERRRSQGASLSGGERQMLAIAKALIRRPRLLLLDEPSIGLAPAIVDEVQRIVAELNAQGLAVIIGEQSVDWVLSIAGRGYAIAAGRLVAEGPARDLADANALADRYLGLSSLNAAK